MKISYHFKTELIECTVLNAHQFKYFASKYLRKGGDSIFLLHSNEAAITKIPTVIFITNSITDLEAFYEHVVLSDKIYIDRFDNYRDLMVFQSILLEEDGTF